MLDRKFTIGNRVTIIPTEENKSNYQFNGTVIGYMFNKVLVVFDESNTGFPYELDESKLKLLEGNYVI
jgi:hypothetical protein